MTAVDNEIDLDSLIDWESEIICQTNQNNSNKNPCEQPAHWVIQFVPCGLSRFKCDKHVQMWYKIRENRLPGICGDHRDHTITEIRITPI